MDQRKIGLFINSLRKEKGMTQYELGCKMGVSTNAVSKWERGLSMPDVSLLRPLSDELNISVNELLLGERIDNDELVIKTDNNIINTIKTKNSEKRASNIKIIILNLIIFILMVIFFIYFQYIRGYLDENIIYNVDLKQNKIIISGMMSSSDKIYNSYSISRKNNVIKIVTKSTNKSIFNNNNSFNMEFDINNDSQVYLNNNLVYIGNETITAYANELYNNKNKYIGNMVKNNSLAQTLNIKKIFGDYTNSLKTSDEPYEWQFLFSKQYESDELLYMNNLMKKYSIVLLALVDNLGSVGWEFNGISNNLSIEEANTYLKNISQENKTVKDYGKSIETINQLLDLLNINN